MCPERGSESVVAAGHADEVPIAILAGLDRRTDVNVGPGWEDRGVTDRRFSTVLKSTADLLSVVDIDDVGDIETLLMFLFARPVSVEEVWDDEGAASSLDVIVHGNDESIGSTHDFPMSVADLVRSCAETVDDLGPYTRDQFTQEESPDVSTMSDAELTTALQQCLGKVRAFKMMDAADG